MSKPEQGVTIAFHCDPTNPDRDVVTQQFGVMVEYTFRRSDGAIIELFQSPEASLTSQSPVWRRIWADRGQDPHGTGSGIPEIDAQRHPMRFLPDSLWQTPEDMMFFAQVRGVLNHVANIRNSGVSLSGLGIGRPEEITDHLRHGLVLASHTGRLRAVGAIFAHKYTTPEFVQEAQVDAVRGVFGLTYDEKDEEEVRRLLQVVVANRENSFAGNLSRVARLVDEFGRDKYSKNGYLEVDKAKEAAFLRAMAKVSLEPGATPSPLIEALRRK